jgi:uncharacterized phage protein (TIGR01671 family)
MREILFRGKSKQTSEWVYGSLYQRGDKSFILRDHWQEINYQGAPIRDVFDGVEVYPETVGQYTGLKDKNGNKIFEGDIVDMGLTGIFPILWDDVMTGFICGSWCGHGFSIGKVIGNIHDNTKLLEVNK